MSRASPQMRHFAKRLIIFETRGNIPTSTKPRPVFPIPDKLRPHLTTLMGDGGFRALLARALALAQPEVPWLRGVHMNADGTMVGLEELQAQIGPDEFLEGRIELLAQLLGLLVAFIGENLTLRLVREAWPKVPLDDLDFGNGGVNGNGATNGNGGINGNRKTNENNKTHDPMVTSKKNRG